jgi:hypothetical protein
MPDAKLVQGSTGRSIGYRMLVPDAGGERLRVLSWREVLSVLFKLAPADCPGAGALLGGSATQYGDDEDGVARYDFTAVDTRAAQLLWGAFEVTLVGGLTITLPEDRYLSVLVFPKVGARAA